MILVLSIAAVLWGIGAVMGAPNTARFIMLGALMAGVLLIQITLPVGAPLRAATGGDVRLWLLILGFVGLVAVYSQILKTLRRRAANSSKPVQPTQNAPTFSDAELTRYARHIILREIGGPGQKALKEARVLVIGAGGLGAPALLYLAAAGVGKIGIVDDDVVDGSNLQRQIIHTEAQIGQSKVLSAQSQMRALNQFVDIAVHATRLDEQSAESLFESYDLILDGTDNFQTRFMVNRTAARLGKPLISGAITQWEGQISLYDPARGTPCYECVFPEEPAPGLAPSCAEAGVVGPLPGVMGSMMALEAIKALTGAGETLKNRLMIFDALYADTRIVKIAPRENCPVCSALQSE